MSLKIGIMQGRLSNPIHNTIQAFPENTWEKEFKIASQIGLDCIEWIFDTYSNNPIMSNTDHINDLRLEYGIEINSVCADYFMINKLFGETKTNIEKNLETLLQLAKNCKKIGIRIIEIPLVDSSSLKSEKDKKQLVDNLERKMKEIEDLGISIALETDLDPEEFLDLLNMFKEKSVGANYDSGNSASLGYHVNEELDVLGDKIMNIHVKDRILHGGTVPLGLGNVNFNDFFLMLKKINYSGDLIIQGAREQELSPKENCIKYQKFTKQYLDKYYQ